jgi:hypothetical protein
VIEGTQRQADQAATVNSTVIGIVAGLAILLLMAGLLIFILLRRRRKPARENGSASCEVEFNAESIFFTADRPDGEWDNPLNDDEDFIQSHGIDFFE